jgi:Tfp pilus assembly protein PilO
MSESPNKLIRFWQELKRRKVFSVVTTYAATSYIIIEVVNNLIGPLHLPDWLATLVVILLIIGLPVVIILSWIFDFTPQGIKKTESLEELESKEILIKPVKRKLRTSYVLNAILIIAVIVLAYPKIFKQNTLERLRSSGERI